MGKERQTFRTTLVGGLLFLLPIILVTWLLSKALTVAEKVSQPVVKATGVDTVGGVAFGTIVGIAALIAVSLFAGLLARTKLGQATFSGLENSVLSVFPQWRMARGLIESFGSDKMSQVDVVLVPTDAGSCIGFVMEKPAGDWWTIFIPGAPQWTSGGLSFVNVSDIRQTGLSFAEAIILLRRCGAGSVKIPALLGSAPRVELVEDQSRSS